MSYRPQIPVMVRSAARYVDRIIKGEKTGDLPLSNPWSGTHCKSQDCQGSRPRNTADAARMKIPRWGFIALLSGVLSGFLCVSAPAQEGYYGAGHDKWHEGFYSKLKRNDGQGSCCNLMDCRPTQSRMVGDHYEVKVDGEWMPVPKDKINNVVAPDGGAHVCAPRQEGRNKGVLFCVILPSEG